MRYVTYDTVRQNMGDNIRTVQDFGHFLGRSPHRLGIAASLYKNNTSMQLLDRLFNIHQLPKTTDKFKAAKDMTFEWGIEIQKMKEVRIVDTVLTDGRQQSDVLICLEEPYFFPNDTFVINGSRDQLFVTAPYVKTGHSRYEYTCKVVTSDVSKGLNLSFATKGNTVRFRSNYHAELSEKRYSRYQSNIERHRNYLSLHGVAKRMSGQYALQENYFIETNSKKEGTVYYKLDPTEKACYDEFMEVRNNHLLFGKSNHTEAGVCLMQDERGFDIPMGDGMVTQIERYAEKFMFSNLTTGVVRDVMQVMKQKSQDPTGNKYIILCNEDFQMQFYGAMLEELKSLNLPATALYSKTGTDYKIDVGANFESYIYLGNQVTIVVDREMSKEYSDRAYGIFLDITQDLSNGRPAIELFTLDGAEMITGTLKGLGGTSGKASGDVSSPIHGYQYDIIGYSGVAVYNPFRSFIIEESKATFL